MWKKTRYCIWVQGSPSTDRAGRADEGPVRRSKPPAQPQVSSLLDTGRWAGLTFRDGLFSSQQTRGRRDPSLPWWASGQAWRNRWGGTGEQGGPGGGQTLVPREKQAAELGTHQGSQCPGLPTLRCCQAMTLSVALILSGTQGGSF